MEGGEHEEMQARSYSDVLRSGLCKTESRYTLTQRSMLPNKEKRPDGEKPEKKLTQMEKPSNRRDERRERHAEAPCVPAEDPSPEFRVEKRQKHVAKPTPGSKRESEEATSIWIIGSGYIAQAEEAAYEAYGANFGFNAKVYWFGKGGRRWVDVLPFFYDKLSTQRPPDVLVIHAGGNDLGLVPAHHLAESMRSDLTQLHGEFPAMKIVFSYINERQLWPGNPGDINNDRKKVNNSVAKTAAQIGVEVVKHPNIKFFKKQLYADGVHFSLQGNRIFLSAIHDTLTKVMEP